MEKNRIINLVGNKYGKLTVLELVGNSSNGILWKCMCDCGRTKIILGRSLKSGNTQSCGCGMLDHPEKMLDDCIEDTRIGNLTRGEQKNNTSGKKGVYYNKAKGLYFAELTFQKTRHFLGYFKTFEQAKKAREEAEIKYHGSFLEEHRKHIVEKEDKKL